MSPPLSRGGYERFVRPTLFAMDPESTLPACEISTPTLAAFEWARQPEKLALPAQALAKMQELTAAAAAPSPRLRAAARRSKK